MDASMVAQRAAEMDTEKVEQKELETADHWVVAKVVLTAPMKAQSSSVYCWSALN